MQRPIEEWERIGREAIMDIVDPASTDGALVVTVRELEARISDAVWPGLPMEDRDRVFPHVLTRARATLVGDGHLEYLQHETKGRVQVNLLATTMTVGRTTRIKAAIRRKAMLYGRYLRWASGPVNPHFPEGLVGVAGETVLAKTIRSNLTRFTPYQQPGNVNQFLGVSLGRGSFDDAAILVEHHASGQPATIFLPMEMKNVRNWIYESGPELWQLLHWACTVTTQRPHQLICPVLICRRRHPELVELGKAMGFYAVQTRLQFVRPHHRIEPDHFEEVREGLGFNDLVLQKDLSPRLRNVFDIQLRRDALVTANTWRTVGSTYCTEIAALRNARTNPARSTIVQQLRADLDLDPTS